MARKKKIEERPRPVYVEGADEIEERKRKTAERKAMMEKMMESASPKEIKHDMESLASISSATSVRQIKNAGRVMLGRFEKLLQDIDLVSDPATRVRLQIDLTRLFVSEIPSKISKSLPQAQEPQQVATDALYEPID